MTTTTEAASSGAAPGAGPGAAPGDPGARGGLLGSTLARHVGLGLLAIAVVVALSLALGPYRNVQLAQVAYLVCAAAGLSVLTGISGQISLGQGAFMAVGAYTTALLFLHASLPLPGVLLVAPLVSALSGGLVGAAAARLRGPYLAGATLAFAIGLPSIVSY